MTFLSYETSVIVDNFSPLSHEIYKISRLSNSCPVNNWAFEFAEPQIRSLIIINQRDNIIDKRLKTASVADMV